VVGGIKPETEDRQRFRHAHVGRRQTRAVVISMASPTSASSGTTDLVRGFAGVLGRHKLLFLLGVLLGGGLCAGLYAITPKIYVSNSQLLITKKRPEGGAVDTRDAIDDFVGTHQGLLKSPLLVKRAIRDDSLDARPALYEAGRELPETILRNLSVSRQRDSMGLGTSILALSYRAADPADASEVLSALLKAYRKTVDEVYAHTTDDVRDMFERARTDLSRELLDKETAYQAFRKNSPLLWKGKDGVNPHQERLANLETKRSALLLQEAETQGKLTALENAVQAGVDRDTLRTMVSELAKPEIESIRQNQVGRWQEQVLLLVQQEQKLRERFGDDHPEVKSVRESLAAARAFLNRPAAAAEGSGSGLAIDPVKARIASLRQELEQLKTTGLLVARLCQDESEAAAKLSGFEVDDEMHRNDLQRTQLLFEALLKRLQDASLAKDSGGFEATVIAPPGSDGIKKVQPSGLLFASAAVLLGLVFGTGFTVLAEMRDHRFRDIDEVRSLLELPMLGRIPSLASRRSRDATALLTTVADRASRSAEAFRGLRSTLATAFGDGKVLQVASPRGGDGTTALAANLAVVLAAAGKRVVLVEANLTSPRLADVFARGPAAGIVAALRSDGPLEQFLVAGPTPNLSLLLAEHRLATPGDILAGPDFAALIGSLRERFDLVILDGPPLCRADAVALVGLTDGVLLAANFVRTTRPDAVRAVDALREMKSRVVGVVVNEAASAETFEAAVR
jgi:Mrp family chromosome partitioning ATPase/uncharacterized protein involved in exopolysaccharide biosynthesis